MAKISIIVPVYKVEKYISKCIESVIAQSFSDWELILVDDGSPDKSGDICNYYSTRDSRIQTIHKPNGGVSSARNVGISKAQGEWLYFIDSDDFIEDETLKKAIDKARSSNSDLIVHGLVDDYLYSGKSRKIQYAQIEDDDYKSIIETTDKAGLLKGPVCKLFRQSIITEHNLSFDESICYGEDTKFTFEYLRVCKSIAFVPEHLYHYCFRSNESLTKKKYSCDFWLSTASMLIDVRMPIVHNWSMPESYLNYVRQVYFTHLILAINSLYNDKSYSKQALYNLLDSLKIDSNVIEYHPHIKYHKLYKFVINYRIVSLCMIALLSTFIKNRR